MKIDFEQIEWTDVAPGAKQKVRVTGDQQMRLLRLEHGFEEADWCLKGHIGYVLEGAFRIDFDGTMEVFRKGDGLAIPGGADHKHKALIGEGESVELLLFEAKTHTEALP